MSSAAREKLFEKLFYATSSRACSEAEEESYRKEAQSLINAFAHELAEQQRAEADTWEGWPEKTAAMRYAASLIDPEGSEAP